MIRNLFHRTGLRDKSRSFSESLFDRIIVQPPRIALARWSAGVLFFGFEVRRSPRENSS